MAMAKQAAANATRTVEFVFSVAKCPASDVQFSDVPSEVMLVNDPRMQAQGVVERQRRAETQRDGETERQGDPETERLQKAQKHGDRDPKRHRGQKTPKRDRENQAKQTERHTVRRTGGHKRKATETGADSRLHPFSPPAWA